MELVTIAVAARRLSLSRASVRRRLASGELTGQQVPRPQGSVWLVSLPAAGGTSRDLPGRDGTSQDVTLPGETSRDVRHVPGAAARVTDPAPVAPQTAILAQRAEDMAIYSHRLLEPYVAQIAAQAEEIGHLKAELEQARTQLVEATSTTGQAEHGGTPPPPSEAERPGWWTRFVTWASGASAAAATTSPGRATP
jgi:hypothetical protein